MPMIDKNGVEVFGGFEYKRIEQNSVANIALTEKLVEQGWKIINSNIFAVTLEKKG